MKDPIFRAADSGDPYACLGVAYYYHEGKEVDFDIDAAITWYERAAARGCPRAHWELAKLFIEGKEVPPNQGMYLDHLVSASDMGNVDAQYALACEYRWGRILQKDDQKAFECFKRAAEMGHVRSKFMVGYMIQHGIVDEGTRGDAEMWFASVGVSGDADTFLDIGLDYEYGLNGVEPSLLEAIRWYQYGADMGHQKCIICYNSAVSTLAGKSVDGYEGRMEKLMNTDVQRETDRREHLLNVADEYLSEGDDKAAFESYMESAKLGDADGMFAVAMMYHQGIHVKRNDKKALELLMRAASAGSCDAQFFLGRAYDNDEYPRDETQAIKYYAQAAANGFLAAFYYLGRYVDHPEVYVRRVRGHRIVVRDGHEGRPRRRSGRPGSHGIHVLQRGRSGAGPQGGRQMVRSGRGPGERRGHMQPRAHEGSRGRHPRRS